MKNEKVVAFDLECTPKLAYVWRGGKQYVAPSMMTDRTTLLTVAWQFEGQKPQGLTVDPAMPRDDYEIVKKLRDVLKDADVIIGHNMRKFDMRLFNARLLEHGLEPLDPYIKIIDTLQVARRHFMLDSYKLDDMCQDLGLGAKHETNFQLWLDCMVGDKKALKQMLAYNKQDVKLTLELYRKLEPFHKDHKHYAEGNEAEGYKCGHCKSEKVQKRGWQILAQNKRRRVHCQECGRWSAGKELIKREV